MLKVLSCFLESVCKILVSVEALLIYTLVRKPQVWFE